MTPLCVECPRRVSVRLRPSRRARIRQECEDFILINTGLQVAELTRADVDDVIDTPLGVHSDGKDPATAGNTLGTRVEPDAFTERVLRAKGQDVHGPSPHPER